MKIKLSNENFKSNWVNNLLISRGIDEENLNNLKNPSIDYLNEPDKLLNMQWAAESIITAVKEKKKFGLLIDSDVDGITSATIIYHYLHEIYPEIDITYFFHDHKEHGLDDSWFKFVDAKVDILIQPDSGINDKKYHDLLGEKNIQTIVLDHHEYENEGFSEYAIYVDNQTSPDYPNKNLAGCGITWQCCRMIDKILGTDYAFKYIDLVALGCAADVMSPLSLENRFIFDYGFNHVQDKAFIGLYDKQSYSMKGIINYTSVAFYIAPLINAAMRTGEPEEKLLMYKMFLHPERKVISEKRGSKGELVNITEECARVLTNVKARQQRLIERYLTVFEERIQTQSLFNNNIIVIQLTDKDTFDSELNGLLAMKISSQYNKPCLIVRAGPDGLSKGSARNPNASPIPDLKEFYSICPYVAWSLGHSNAHGSAIQTDKLNAFVEWFNEHTSNLSFAENCYNVNFLLTPSDNYLEQLCWEITDYDNLWGGNNSQPTIALQNYHLNPSDFQVIGSNKDTIKFYIGNVCCIVFRNQSLAAKLSKLDSKVTINAVGRPAINDWNGSKTIQLILDDIEVNKFNICEF